jgi:hypothetical protein
MVPRLRASRKIPADLIEFVAIPQFRDLPVPKLRAVRQLGTLVDVAGGRVLSHPDACALQIVVILQGAVVSTFLNRPQQLLLAGRSFATPSYYDDEVECFYAVSSAMLFVISQREYSSLRRAEPPLAERLWNESHHRAPLMDERLELTVLVQN